MLVYPNIKTHNSDDKTYKQKDVSSGYHPFSFRFTLRTNPLAYDKLSTSFYAFNLLLKSKNRFFELYAVSELHLGLIK